MANEYKIAIVMVAEDKASKVLKQLAEGTDDAAKSIEELDDKAGDSSKSLFNLENAMSAAGIIAGAKFAVDAGKAVHELAELGAQGLRTEKAFYAISGGADEANRRLDAMKTATRGAMSEMELMGSANMLMQMGLANNSEELARLTQMATKLGAAMGNEAGPSIENFALMLANQSVMRLDSFGISSGKVRDRIAELQKATEGLSREQAFMQAVMEEGTKSMERLGDAAEDEALQFERLEAQLADTKMELAQKVTPVWADFLSLINRGIGEAQIWTTRWKQAVGGIAAGTLHIVGANDAALDLLHSMDLVDDAALNVASSLSTGQMADYAAMMGETTIVTDEAAEAQNELATAANRVASSFGEMEFDNESLWNLALASGASIEALSALAQQLGIANSAEVQASIKSYELVEAFGAGTISAKEYADQMARLASATADADARLAAIEARGGPAGAGPRRYQHGTMNHPGGWGIVGEEGPEALWMPPGSQVYPNGSAMTQSIQHQGDVYHNRTINVGTELALALEANRAAQEQTARANALM